MRLAWKEGAGYDVHLLRGGRKSAPLRDFLVLDGRALTSSEADLVAFVPHLIAGSDKHGVEIDSQTGTVRALAHPDPGFPKVTNFLLSAVFPDSGGITREVEIRIHVHDSINAIWLTPRTLTIHLDANECRFTVFARFSDRVVGDITDWDPSELSFQSADHNVVQFSSGGRLKAMVADQSSTVTATVSVGAMSWNTDPVRVLTKARWDDYAKAAKSAVHSVMSPTNLPTTLSNLKKLTLPDVIGIYEGGAYHDGGVYRPAGRCKMRTASDKLMPFCHVCRYLIVDRVDPTKHGQLDAIYNRHYPRA
jgi:hypothetical protein